MTILQIAATLGGGGAEETASRLHIAFRERGLDAWLGVGRLSGTPEGPSIVSLPSRWHGSRWGMAAEYLQRAILRLSGGRGSSRVIPILDSIIFPRAAVDLFLGREAFGPIGSRHVLDLLPMPPDVLLLHNLHADWSRREGFFDLRSLPGLSHRIPTILRAADPWLLTGHCAHPVGCPRWRVGCGRCMDLTLYPRVVRDGTAYSWRRKRSIYRRSRLYVIVPSRWLASLFEGARFPAREVRLIPNGVDARLFEPGDKDSARREAALSTDRKIVLVVGNYLRTNPWKNFDTALAVARRLGESDSPAGIDLVCAGESGETMHIGTVRVLFMGRNLSRAAMANLYRASDVFLHPSRADTFPISVLEAMSAGLPIVASCVGGVPEQVVEGQTGFLLRPGDSAGMAAAVHSLLSDAAKAERLGAAGRARVLEFFRFEVQVEATIDFLREVAARRPHDQRHEAGESTASLAPDARS